MLEFKERVVLVVHNGSQKYFKNAMKSVIKEGYKVIHVGNTNLVLNGMLSLEMPDTGFRENYIHMSFNGYENELVCFERWFAIKIVAEKFGLEQFWHLDSDVILTNGWKKFAKEIEGYRDVFLVSNNGQDFSAHVSFWTLKELSKFCSHITHSYTPKVDVSLINKWEHHRSNSLPGGVCDMTLLKYWVKTENKGVNFGVMDYHIQDNLNVVFGEKMYLEDLRIRKNMVFDRTGLIVPFIHCQGRAKWLLRFRSFLSLRLSYLTLRWLYFGIRILS